MVKEKRLIDVNVLSERISIITADGTCPLHIAAEIDQEIALAPTVDAVEVVHGRWEFRRREKYSWCTDAVCTACETVIDTHIDNDVEYRQEAIKKKLLYCPNCGAKMDGDGNG